MSPIWSIKWMFSFSITAIAIRFIAYSYWYFNGRIQYHSIFVPFAPAKPSPAAPSPPVIYFASFAYAVMNFLRKKDIAVIGVRDSLVFVIAKDENGLILLFSLSLSMSRCVCYQKYIWTKWKRAVCIHM